DLAFRVIVDDHPQRLQHRHYPRGSPVEVLADAVLQHRHLEGARELGDADPLAEGPYGLRRVAAPADAADGRHARGVPAADVTALHQLQQLALAHHRVGEVQPGELDLLRGVDTEFTDVPVVQRAVVLELQRANRMRDALDGVRLAVGEVVHRVDAPLVADVRVRGVQDAVHDRVAQVEVGRPR